MSSLRLSAIFIFLVTLLAISTSTAAPISFQDTYNRDDGILLEDSIGTTEEGLSLTILDYRELGGCCGSPSVKDIAELSDGKLVIHGLGTDPAWVELAGAGIDLDFQLV